MLVICEECSKKYNVDETMMRGERARFSCYECGHVIVVDCVFHDIRPVIPREGGHAFHVIPAACSSDSGQAVGAKRRGWLLGTSFLGVTSSWLSFSASILL